MLLKCRSSCRNCQLEDEGRRSNAVALRKNSADLKEVVDKVIQKLKDEGTYQSYLEKAASLTEVEQ